MNMAENSAAEHLAPENAEIDVFTGAGTPNRPPARSGKAADAAFRRRPYATTLAGSGTTRSSWRQHYPLTLCLAVFAVTSNLWGGAQAAPALSSGSAGASDARLAPTLRNASPSREAKPAAVEATRNGRPTAPAFPASAAVQFSNTKSVATKPALKLAKSVSATAVPSAGRVSVPSASVRTDGARIVNVSGDVTNTNDEGVARIRLAQRVEPIATESRAVITAPSVANSMPLAPAAISGLGAAKKVITVKGLELPPLSRPLPVWMQAAAVRVDRLEKPSLPAPARQVKPGTRVSQNPSAPPVRQPAQPVTNSDRLPNQIQVAVSTFVVLLTTTDLQTVAVADPTIADVAVVNARAVLLNGKAPGVTSLVIVDKQKIRQYTVRVTSAPGTQPVDVATAIGLPGVSVRPLRDALVLEGEVGTADEARRAVEIAGIYSPKVINQLTIRGAQSAETGTAALVQDLLSSFPGVRVKVAGESVILTGTVDSPQQIVEAETIARAAGKNLTIVNLIRLPALTVDQARTSLGAVDPTPNANTATPVGVAGALVGPDPFTLQQIGDQVILEGTLPSQAAVDAALSTANRTGLTVVNRLRVAPAPSDNQNLVSLVASAIGRPGITVRGTPKRLVLEGVVPDTNAAVAAEQIARGFTLPNGQVDNLLLTPNPQAIDVDVSIVEISRNDLKNLGIRYGESFTTSQTATGGTIDPSVFDEGQFTGGNGFGGTGGFETINPIRARLTALYTNGNARLLSNPRTTVLSGRTATFQVGGQVAIPRGTTTNGSGTSTAIEFKDFGVLVDVVPVASTEGNVTLRVRTEVSQPDFTIATTIAGTVVPGFSRRATVTEVTVPRGGTLALSGLIQDNVQRNASKIPVLGDIPILGSLFRSKRYQRNETELAIFVSPSLLTNTLPAGQLAPASPVAVGENSNVATTLGNPGISVFNSGQAINGIAAGASSGGGGAASQ